MPMSEHDIGDIREIWLSTEDGKPTLWDSPGEKRIRAVWIVHCDDPELIIVTTEPETVGEFLGEQE